MSRASVRGGIATAMTAATLAALSVGPVAAQETVTRRGTENIEVLAHIPLGGSFTVSDINIEQEMSRPFVYVSRMFETGFDVIDVGNPGKAKRIYSWRIENADLHQGTGAMDPKHFKLNDRYYLVQSVQFAKGGPDNDLGAVVFDVTGLPDPSKVKEVGRIRAPDTPGGFHNIFVYKHSDGRVLLFTTTRGSVANVYDMGAFLKNPKSEDPKSALVAQIPIPSGVEANEVSIVGYHDLYAAYHPASGRDRYYGGGRGGYYVYDITDVSEPKLLASVTGVAGVRWGHTFIPTPDGRYAVGETEYQYAPLRIFDLKPGLDGEVATISHPIAAWTANWQNLVHNHQIRWPYVFVSGYEDGLQVFSMEDPANPQTVAYYDTFMGAHKTGMCSDKVCNGAFGVDVRNADGLIVLSDMQTGFWAFHMEGFDGWNGRDWGMPDISNAQDWDHGPKSAERSMATGDR